MDSYFILCPPPCLSPLFLPQSPLSFCTSLLLSLFPFLSFFLAGKARLFVPKSFPPLALAEHVPAVSFNTLFHRPGLLWTGSSPRGLISYWFNIFGKTTSRVAVCPVVKRHMRSGCLPFFDIEIDQWVQELSA